MLASHSALCGSTGKFAMGVFQTLSAGNMGQLGAPGRGVPADATSGVATPMPSPSPITAAATNVTAGPLFHRRTGSPPTTTVPHASEWPRRQCAGRRSPDARDQPLSGGGVVAVGVAQFPQQRLLLDPDAVQDSDQEAQGQGEYRQPTPEERADADHREKAPGITTV